jgi:SAM-dependent methyltransferase
MRLNRVEFALMNNPVRAAIQRRVEARRLLAMGGEMRGGTALEIGCGRGVGVEIILDLFGAERVDAFDLDSRMIDRARRRLRSRGEQVRLWKGSATSIRAEDGKYDAVFDFGIIHHVPSWRDALAEVRRVLRAGGRFYAEEVFASFITRRPVKGLLKHPEHDRFDHDEFCAGLADAGLELIAARQLWGAGGWFIADKPVARACSTRDWRASRCAFDREPELLEPRKRSGCSPSVWEACGAGHTDVQRLGCQLAVTKTASAGDRPRWRPQSASGVRICQGDSGRGARDEVLLPSRKRSGIVASLSARPVPTVVSPRSAAPSA